MRALILSGGSNKGAIQVGAMRALLEENINFDLVIGVSIGALNGIYFSYKPTLQGINELERIWLNVKKEDIFGNIRISAIMNLLRNKESVFSNEKFREFIIRVSPVRTFSELKLKCYIIALDIMTGKEYIFGKNKYESIVDAILSSTALPPYFPPYSYKGMKLVDGGFYSNLPYKIAIDEGAKEIWALHIKGKRQDFKKLKIIGILNASIDYLLTSKIREQENFISSKKVKIHYIPLECHFDLSIFNFSQTRKLIDLGYEITKSYLSQHKTKEGIIDKIKSFFKK
ncbi:MAG: patatin-like phospholipase family protein [candidate division WOR-3 bacterium]|jgi:NTE family protein